MRRMSVFDRLAAEHARIEAVGGALDAFADRMVAAGGVDLHELVRFVTFFRGYAEGLHHQREESVLLPALALAGFAPDSAPLGFIRDQHRQEERLLFDVGKVVSAKAPWSPEQLVRMAEALHAFVTFERGHMQKERELLLPHAAQQVGHNQVFADELTRLEARFERARVPAWDVSWLESLAGELVEAHPQAG